MEVQKKQKNLEKYLMILDIIICRPPTAAVAGYCYDYFARDVGKPTLDTLLGGTNDVFDVSLKVDFGILYVVGEFF